MQMPFPFNNTRKKYGKLSFSQTGEDLIVQFIFNTLGIVKPSYIDIGAHHPYSFNNTAIFYMNGSRGINIEPNPFIFNEFKKHRKKDINLNIGISDSNAILDFYILNASRLSTFSHEIAEGYKNNGMYYVESIKKVPVDTIGNIIQKYSNMIFPDFLTIDTEGTEDIILKSIDYQTNSPIVICFESLSFSECGMGKKNNELIGFLLSKNYMLFADTYINSIFVRKDNWIRNKIG